MQKALHELAEMDELAAGGSPIHGLCAPAKLLTTIAYIAVVLSFHKYDLSGMIVLLLYPVLLFQISGVSVGSFFYKLRIVLPLVLAVGLFNPFFDRQILVRVGSLGISGGVISMVTLMLKGVLCLMASYLLMATTPIDVLCAALRKFRVPGTLVTLLLLTYRYIGVMTEELAVMTEAYSLRAPGQKGIHVSAWGSFLGQLLLRSMDRAEELYNSMLLRGYHQHFHYAPVKDCGAKDRFFALGCIALFLLLRFVNVARLLGGLLVR